jgi:hypothetical protein
MPRFMNPIDQLAIPLPISSAARQTADAFAQAQPTSEKADAVRLNTLAVWVTRDYCQMMDIPTDLAGSDSWNPLMQLMTDVADLHLPGLGQLECRPVREDATVCQVPPEVWDLRVGYVVVAIAEDQQTAQLLGFCPEVQAETLALSELQPLEGLLDHLHALRQQASITDMMTNRVAQTVVHLGQWLNGVIDAGWQAVDTLLSPDASPAFSFRSGHDLDQAHADFPMGHFRGTDTVPPLPLAAEGLTTEVSRAKLIDLAIRLGRQQVVLLVNLQGQESGPRQIGLQVHPTRRSPYLPPGLELAVLEADGTTFMQAQSREADNFIQLRFSGQPAEHFWVQIQWQDATYVEDFVI